MKELSRLCLLLLLILTACSSGEEEMGTPDAAPAKPKPVVYENQERNQPCRKTADCLDGLLCINMSEQGIGVCSDVCEQDRDCGNDMLCRSGSCQADCAVLNEKCSTRRVCCFYDDDEDGFDDSACLADASGGDERCRIMPKRVQDAAF